MSKVKVRRPTPHPAKFTPSILATIDELLGDAYTVLDPFAGVGRIHSLYPARETYGIEIEPEWANQHERTWCGNALALPYPDKIFDAIATSPCYGNRMADHHNAKDPSKRTGYKFALNRDPHPQSSAVLYFGPAYEDFHVAAWTEAIRVLKDGGRFVLNISDHIKDGKEVAVSNWHAGCLVGLGLTFEYRVEVETPRMRRGANRDLRVPHEYVMLFTKTPF